MTCSICLSDISENKIILNCEHEFHFNCLNEWINRNNSCPLCRKTTVNHRLIRYCHVYDNISNDNKLNYVVNNNIIENRILNNNILNRITEEEIFILKNILKFNIHNPIFNIENIKNDYYYLVISNNNHIIIGKLDIKTNNIVKLVNSIFLYRINGYINSSNSKLININLNKDLIYLLSY